jgi:hypothetical protein
MNFKEGVRRLGILLGVAGALAGTYAAYPGATHAWGVRLNAQRFEALMLLPIAKDVARLAKDFQATHRPGAKSFDYEILVRMSHGYRPTLQDLAVSVRQANPDAWYYQRLSDIELARQVKQRDPGNYDDYEDRSGEIDPLDAILASLPTVSPPPPPPPGYVLDPPTVVHSARAQGRGTLTVVLNRDGIREATADSNGDILWFALIAGGGASRPQTPPMSLPAWALYPLAGFLLPWAALRALVWAASGFVTPPPQ